MDQLKPGDVADIAIKGARVTEVHGTTGVVNASTVGGAFITFGPDDFRVTAERITPTEWPPQVNDLWRDRFGDLWFAMENHDGHVLLTDRTGGRCGPDYVSHQNGPLTLVHREDEQTGGESR